MRRPTGMTAQAAGGARAQAHPSRCDAGARPRALGDEGSAGRSRGRATACEGTRVPRITGVPCGIAGARTRRSGMMRSPGGVSSCLLALACVPCSQPARACDRPRASRADVHAPGVDPLADEAVQRQRWSRHGEARGDAGAEGRGRRRAQCAVAWPAPEWRPERREMVLRRERLSETRVAGAPGAPNGTAGTRDALSRAEDCDDGKAYAKRLRDGHAKARSGHVCQGIRHHTCGRLPGLDGQSPLRSERPALVGGRRHQAGTAGACTLSHRCPVLCTAPPRVPAA